MRLPFLVASLGLLVGLSTGCSSGNSNGPAGTGATGGTWGSGGAGASGGAAGAGGSGGSVGGQGGSGGTTSDASPCGDTASDPHNCGACGHDCLGGACQAGQCQPAVMRDNFESRNWFLVDDNQLYWSSYTDGKIMHGPKTPGAADTLLRDVTDSPQSFSQSAKHLAWVGCDNGPYCFGSDASTHIEVMDKQGSAPVQLGAQAYAFVLDDTNAYFLSGDQNSPGAFRVPLGGGLPQPLPAAQGNPSFYGFYAWSWIVQDSTTLYVGGGGYSGQGHVIYAVPKNGGGAHQILQNPDQFADLAVGPDQLVVGYGTAMQDCSAAQSLTITTVPKTGGTEKTLVSQSAILGQVRTDGKYVYWQQVCNGSLWRVAISGGTPEELWKGDDYGETGGLELDDTGIYFVAVGNSQLMRLAK